MTSPASQVAATLGMSPMREKRARRFPRCCERRIEFTYPERDDQIARRGAKGSCGGSPPAFDQAVYAGRNVVERCFNRLKQFRELATRYAKRAAFREPAPPAHPARRAPREGSW
jgi:transposase